MSATTSFQSEVLRHILLNEAIADLGDAAGMPAAATEGFVYICLLTQDPGEAGSIVNEATFGGYARVAVPRGATGWIESGGQIQNISEVDFVQCTDGSETITHFGICKSLTGDDMIFNNILPSPAMVFIEILIRMEVGQLAVNMD
jgi:hypothetical protein